MVITAVLHAEHSARHMWSPGPGSGLGHRPGSGDEAPENSVVRTHVLPLLTAAQDVVLLCALQGEGDLEERGNVELWKSDCATPLLEGSWKILCMALVTCRKQPDTALSARMSLQHFQSLQAGGCGRWG